MKVIMVSSDRNIFKEGSAVRSRMTDYARLFDELHVIVFTSRFRDRGASVHPGKIGPNLWVYPTRSLSRWLYVRGAARIGKSILSVDTEANVSRWAVTAQDPFESGLAALRISQAYSVPLQVQVHTDFASPHFAASSRLNRLRLKIAKVVLPKARAIRVVSNRIRDSIVELYGISKEKITVLPIYTDVRAIASAPVTSDLRKKYPQFSKIVLMASRIEPEKNFPVALEAFAQVRKERSDVGLLIVGSGREEVRIRELVKSMGLMTAVVFEPWQLDLVSYYKTADAFLLASDYEGYGLSLVEAAAAGCPVVSTDVGIARELVGDAVCVPGEPSCLAAGILNALSEGRSAARTPEGTYPEKEAYFKAYKRAVEQCFVMQK